MLLNIKNLNRWQAFGIHLGISGLIFLALLSIIVFIWYPGVFIHMGGWQGIKIVAGVDLVLGPLLTLIVFNTFKKNLKFDLCVIAIIQSSCLAAGTYFIAQERPVAQILSYDAVYILTRSEVNLHELTLPSSASESETKPMLYYLDLPANEEDINTIIQVTEILGSGPLYLRSDLYIPFSKKIETEIEGRLQQFEAAEFKDCRLIKIISKHLATTGCFSADRGLISTVN